MNTLHAIPTEQLSVQELIRSIKRQFDILSEHYAYTRDIYNENVFLQIQFNSSGQYYSSICSELDYEEFIGNSDNYSNLSDSLINLIDRIKYWLDTHPVI